MEKPDETKEAPPKVLSPDHVGSNICDKTEVTSVLEDARRRSYANPRLSRFSEVFEENMVSGQSDAPEEHKLSEERNPFDDPESPSDSESASTDGDYNTAEDGWGLDGEGSTEKDSTFEGADSPRDAADTLPGGNSSQQPHDAPTIDRAKLCDGPDFSNATNEQLTLNMKWHKFSHCHASHRQPKTDVPSDVCVRCRYHLIALSNQFMIVSRTINEMALSYEKEMKECYNRDFKHADDDLVVFWSRHGEFYQGIDDMSWAAKRFAMNFRALAITAFEWPDEWEAAKTNSERQEIVAVVDRTVAHGSSTQQVQIAETDEEKEEVEANKTKTKSQKSKERRKEKRRSMQPEASMEGSRTTTAHVNSQQKRASKPEASDSVQGRQAAQDIPPPIPPKNPKRGLGP